jgi:hypothetical protein
MNNIEELKIIKAKSCADRIKNELSSLNEELTRLTNDPESDEYFNDMALSVDTYKITKICLSYGGPSSYLEVMTDSEGEVISVTYRFSDWFDTATLPVFDFEPAYAYAVNMLEMMSQ